MKRVALLCPGRGSYTERSLGSLPVEHPWVQRADELRAERGLPALSELDRAERFVPDLHLRPVHVSALTWLVSMLDCAQIIREQRCVCVAGNSMGWYTALAVAGALDFDDGFRLAQEMAALQQEARAAGVGGGQVVYPVVDDEWRPDPGRERAVRAALEGSQGQALPSIVLGGYAVLAGSDAGVAHLLRALPPVQAGRNRYPFKLVQHGPYHTPLLEGVAARARERLADLGWRPPRTTLVDGRGVRFTPWSTDAAGLRDYTLGRQVVGPYDFSAALRVVLREHAPDQLVLPGPGNTLGGVCGQVLVAERWQGLDSKSAFEGLQASRRPLVRSLRR